MSEASGSMSEMLDLTGEVALVTGAGRGVGATTAQFLAAQGAAVAVNDFHLERAQAVAAQITAEGGTAIAVGADITEYEQVQAAADLISEQLGWTSILVNNAGNAGAEPAANQPFWESGPEQWAPFLQVNLYGVLACCRAVVPGMISARHGRIITVVSDAGRVGAAGLEAYGAAKAGAAGLMRSLAHSLGRFGITANSVALGITRTPAMDAVLADADLVARVLSRYPLRRVGEPADAAAMISFLASGAGGWITGQTYPVNGGFSVTR
ncbi:putative 3-oxoacyl-[acyl-carrier-protein] reductase [Nocardia nova SH22a]|uniref:3-oxoacyl-[acyl-carrier-protein] reductase MabA n=1 Tax=Nocardia nova SH22a TaxID=1415166 RepID=W5TM03_9NOCA|nr:SDR family oxidoreductase [Nocardia nova]AHH19998.1 putative 3-oxoacyl-[acyl-carrier-protein] reductase [Nocardia nova SH22a]